MTKKEAKDTVEEAFKQAEQYGCASIPLPREDATGKTTIDKLRLRGTPIELIHSYFLADQLAEANAAFRTSLLENIYERLDLIEDLEVAFLPRNVATKNGKDDVHDACFELETTYTDNAMTAVIRLIEELSTLVEEYLTEKMTSDTKRVAILPDESTTTLQWLDGKKFKAEIEISLHLS